ncbi:MAG: FKBP-type peptidyl-prolyl cis-trans isomerase [Fimbriimonadaceae bacterium]|nr:FKBP-type peptidyl-prolyl cis-trans isomerase [Fimbriimonadaceae bacterium]
MQGDIVGALGVGLSLLGSPQAAPIALPSADLLNPKVTITEVRPGSGRSIQPGDLVTIHFQVETAEGRELANTHKRGLPYSIEFRVGDSFWATMLSGMRAGGERRLMLPSDVYFGENGVPGVVPSGTTLMAKIQVISAAPATRPESQTVVIKKG